MVLVLDRNFCELPIGTVCVADVQFKGRGMILYAIDDNLFNSAIWLCSSCNCVHFYRPVEERVGISQGLPSVFIHITDGRWPSSSSFAVCSESCYHRGNKGCL